MQPSPSRSGRTARTGYPLFTITNASAAGEYSGTIPQSHTTATTSIRIRVSDEFAGAGEQMLFDDFEVFTRTAPPLTNPDLPLKCGIKLTVILDESGSIATANAVGNVETGVKTLVNGLKDTGSQMRIVEFSTNGRNAVVGGGSGFATVDAAFSTAVDVYLNNAADNAQIATSYNPGPGEQYTNWEAGLSLRGEQFWPGRHGDVHHRRCSEHSGNSWQLIRRRRIHRCRELLAAVDEMRAIQATGAHVVGLGVGDAATQVNFDNLTNLVEPNNPQTWIGVGALDLRVVDAMRVNTFPELQAALAAVAFALCSPSVSITKKDDAGNPIGGWGFTGTVNVDPTGGGADQYQWISPALGVTADNGAGNDVPQTVLTSPSAGTSTFQWIPNTADISNQGGPQPWNSHFTFTETLPAGWTLAATQELCSVKRLSGGAITTTNAGLSVTNAAGPVVSFGLVTVVERCADGQRVRRGPRATSSPAR